MTVETATGPIVAVAYATRAQALGSIRQFMRADGYSSATMTNDETGESTTYINKHNK